MKCTSSKESFTFDLYYKAYPEILSYSLSIDNVKLYNLKDEEMSLNVSCLHNKENQIFECTLPEVVDPESLNNETFYPAMKDNYTSPSSLYTILSFELKNDNVTFSENYNKPREQTVSKYHNYHYSSQGNFSIKFVKTFNDDINIPQIFINQKKLSTCSLNKSDKSLIICNFTENDLPYNNSAPEKVIDYLGYIVNSCDRSEMTIQISVNKKRPDKSMLRIENIEYISDGCVNYYKGFELKLYYRFYGGEYTGPYQIKGVILKHKIENISIELTCDNSTDNYFKCYTTNDVLEEIGEYQAKMINNYNETENDYFIYNFTMTKIIAFSTFYVEPESKSFSINHDYYFGDGFLDIKYKSALIEGHIPRVFLDYGEQVFTQCQQFKDNIIYCPISTKYFQVNEFDPNSTIYYNVIVENGCGQNEIYISVGVKNSTFVSYNNLTIYDTFFTTKCLNYKKGSEFYLNFTSTNQSYDRTIVITDVILENNEDKKNKIPVSCNVKYKTNYFICRTNYEKLYYEGNYTAKLQRRNRGKDYVVYPFSSADTNKFIYLTNHNQSITVNSSKSLNINHNYKNGNYTLKIKYNYTLNNSTLPRILLGDKYLDNCIGINDELNCYITYEDYPGKIGNNSCTTYKGFAIGACGSKDKSIKIKFCSAHFVFNSKFIYILGILLLEII